MMAETVRKVGTVISHRQSSVRILRII